jgi:hypothetical protein
VLTGLSKGYGTELQRQPLTMDNFDPDAYLAAYPDVAKDPYWGANPLLHFQQHGQFEGRFANLPVPNTTAPKDYGLLNRQFSMQDFQQDPGYQFRLAEGEKAINRAAAARGGYDSGGALKALTRYGQGVASDEYGNAFNRWNTQNNQLYNRFASLAGVGQLANQQVGQAGQGYANAASNIAQNNAANQGNAMLAGANARASGYTGFGNALASGLNAWSMNQQQPQSPWLASGGWWGPTSYGGSAADPWYG